MEEIQLTQNKKTLIDDVDFEKVRQFNWSFHHIDRCSYAARTIINNNGKVEIVLLHRFILDVPRDKEIDHINLNGLDNRRCNLRIATHSQNMANRRLHKNNKSGFKGVCFDKKKNKWKVEIRVDRKKLFFGYFDSKVDAAKIYDKKAIEYFKEFAQTNEMLGLFNSHL